MQHDTPTAITNLYLALKEINFGLRELLGFLAEGVANQGSYPMLSALVACLQEAAEEMDGDDIAALMADAYRRAFYVEATATKFGFLEIYSDPECRDGLVNAVVEHLTSGQDARHTQLTLSADSEHAH